MPLTEMVASNTQWKGRADEYQEASQEQGRLPVGHVCPMSPSGDREKEEGKQSALVKELILQPPRSPYIPTGRRGGGGGGGRGDRERTLGKTGVGPPNQTRGFKSLRPIWNIPEEAEHVLCSPIFWNILRPI